MGNIYLKQSIRNGLKSLYRVGHPYVICFDSVQVVYDGLF